MIVTCNKPESRTQEAQESDNGNASTTRFKVKNAPAAHVASARLDAARSFSSLPRTQSKCRQQKPTSDVSAPPRSAVTFCPPPCLSNCLSSPPA